MQLYVLAVFEERINNYMYLVVAIKGFEIVTNTKNFLWCISENGSHHILVCNLYLDILTHPWLSPTHRVEFFRHRAVRQSTWLLVSMSLMNCPSGDRRWIVLLIWLVMMLQWESQTTSISTNFSSCLFPE